MGGNSAEAAPIVVATAQGPGTVQATASTASQPAASPQPVTPLMEAAALPAPRSCPSPMMQPASPPAPRAAVLLAPWIRQEIHLAAVPRAQPPAERPRVSLEAERSSTVAKPELATVARPEPAGESQPAGLYWVQL